MKRMLKQILPEYYLIRLTIDEPYECSTFSWKLHDGAIKSCKDWAYFMMEFNGIRVNRQPDFINTNKLFRFNEFYKKKQKNTTTKKVDMTYYTR